MSRLAQPRRIAALVLVLAALSGCAVVPRAPRPAVAPAAAPAVSVIPLPAKTEIKPGEFTLTSSTRILVGDGQSEATAVANWLSAFLKAPTGFDLAVAIATGDPLRTAAPDSIILALDEGLSRLGPEGYVLDAAPGSVLIRASKPAGLFYGAQTLRQLFPPEIEARSAVAPAPRWAFRCAHIEDQPRFGWRGMMLDCSRHFFPKEFVLRWIDMLAARKMNVFHWHLVDDQGWRIEIKKYPRLTEVGAWRVDREDKHWNAREPQKPGEAATYGGFYTQADVREVVEYARSRFITVVPEIEMPGHVKASLAAYPEYSCKGGPFTVPPGSYWPNTDVYCPGNDALFPFLEDILTEVMDLFPSSYIHIGGDEVDRSTWKSCPKCQARIKAEGLKDEKELQAWFTKRMEGFLNSRGRKLMGWDEILEGGLAPRAAVMSWRGVQGGIAAAKAGHDVVMSPTTNCYFDYYQGEPDKEPPGIGGYLPLRTVYSYDPVPDGFDAAQAAHILGGQANLWAEYIPNGRHAEYMVLPRMAAMAEIVWTPKALQGWPGFAARLATELRRDEAGGFNASHSAYNVRVAAASRPKARVIYVSLGTEVPQAVVRLTKDGREVEPGNEAYKRPFAVKKTTVVKAAAFLDGKMVSPVASEEAFALHQAMGKRPKLSAKWEDDYASSGALALTDGLLGSKSLRDGRWQGYRGKDFEAVMDLGKARALKSISTRYLQNVTADALLPKTVEYSISNDGLHYTVIYSGRNDVSPAIAETVVKEFAASAAGRTARYVRVKAEGYGPLPEGRWAAGQPSWLMIDEIVIE